jgi:hypothetical protein
MDDKPIDYISYLLRAWRSNGENSPAWQASLENPHTGERMGFACLEDLFDFLRRQTSCPGRPVLDEQGHTETSR